MMDPEHATTECLSRLDGMRYAASMADLNTQAVVAGLEAIAYAILATAPQSTPVTGVKVESSLPPDTAERLEELFRETVGDTDGQA